MGWERLGINIVITLKFTPEQIRLSSSYRELVDGNDHRR
jgi:hypothetical protein